MGAANQFNELPSPELTRVAVDYDARPQAFLMDLIAPVIPVNRDSFRYTKWGREGIKNIDRTLRAIGAPANEASPLTKSYIDGFIEANALKDWIADETLSSSVNPTKTKNKMVGSIVGKLKRGQEAAVKALLDATANTAAIVGKWDTPATTTIESDIKAAKRAMRLSLGLNPTHMIVGTTVADAIIGNATIRELIKYNPNDLLQNGSIPGTLFGLKVLTPYLVQDNALPGAAAALADLWDGETVYFLFVDPSGGEETMTAVARFRNSGDAQPYATSEWRDPDVSTKRSWFGTEVRETPKTLTAEAIYKLTDALA